MNIYLETFIFAIILLAIDGIWIKSYMGKKYKKFLGNNQKDTANYPEIIPAIILAYFVMIIAYPILIKRSNDKDEHEDHVLRDRLIRAAVCGLVIYGTYGFTLAAVFKGYGLGFAFTEVGWGIFLYTIVTLIVYYISGK